MLHVATMLHFMGTGQWATPFGSYKVITSGTNGFTYSPYSCAPVPSQRGCPRLIIQYSQLNHLDPHMRHLKQSGTPSCATGAMGETVNFFFLGNQVPKPWLQNRQFCGDAPYYPHSSKRAVDFPMYLLQGSHVLTMLGL